MEEDPMFLTEEQKVEIDLHDMQTLEAEYYLTKLIDTVPEYVKEITVIHGYRKGQAILNMVRKEFRHTKIKKKVIPYNKGITLIYLK